MKTEQRIACGVKWCVALTDGTDHMCPIHMAERKAHQARYAHKPPQFAPPPPRFNTELQRLYYLETPTDPRAL